MKRAGRSMSELPGSCPRLNNSYSRRGFIRSGTLVAGTFAVASDVFALTMGSPAADDALAIRFGVASYTFRNFTRAQLIAYLKQLNVLALNAKDVKDHLPADAQQ